MSVITKAELDTALGAEISGFYNFFNSGKQIKYRKKFINLKLLNSLSMKFQELLTQMQDAGVITQPTIDAINAI